MSLTFQFDENLREVASDINLLRLEVESLKNQLTSTSDSAKKISLLGQLGVYLRIDGKLNEAERSLNLALEIVIKEKLGLKFEVQQKIRLAHVYQWQKNYELSNALFYENFRFM